MDRQRRCAAILPGGSHDRDLCAHFAARAAQDSAGGSDRRELDMARTQCCGNWDAGVANDGAQFLGWLFTAPLIWMNFHVVSLIAIPLNIVLWPLLVIGLLSGLVLAVSAWLPPVNG